VYYDQMQFVIIKEIFRLNEMMELNLS